MKLHFEELSKRYGNPMVILNLVKCCEKKPRESVLSEEFQKVVSSINTSLPKEKQLEFRSLDLDGLFQTEGISVLTHLNKVAAKALECMGFLNYEVNLPVDYPQSFGMSKSWEMNDDAGNLKTTFGSVEGNNKSEGVYTRNNNNLCKYHSLKPLRIQNGILRTNCIDCLDRTNVAQFVYGFLALCHQLHFLGVFNASELDCEDESLFYKTMEVYKEMGDALAWQYGGSAARCKIFSEKRGEWKPAIQFQETIKTLQRYFSNVYMDIKKQEAINLLLGYHRPGINQLETVGLDANHSSDVEEPILSHEDLISGSSLRPLTEKNCCFICEGISYDTSAHTSDRRYSGHPPARGNWEVFLGPSTSETGSREVSPDDTTSESDILDTRVSP